MGTSTSSKGGGAGSPFDPAWLAGDGAQGGDVAEGESSPGASEEDPSGESSDDGSGDAGQGSAESGAPADESYNSSAEGLAPGRRFAAARTNMAAFLSGGGRASLRAATKSMVNKGMGGPKRSAATMRGTAKGAGQVGQFLAAARDGTDPRVSDWVDRARAAGLSAHDLALEVVREVLPQTGSVDDESLRNAVAEALGMLYESNPEVDIFGLSDQQIADVVGFILANDICNRVDLQLGQTYERLKFDARQVQLYRNDMREYVHAEVRVVMGRVGAESLNPNRLASEVLASTLEVFAE